MPAAHQADDLLQSAEVVPGLVESEVAVPRLIPAEMVGIGRPPRLSKEGDRRGKLPVRLVEREDTAAPLPELPDELRLDVADIATVADVLPLLEEDGFQLPPSPMRLRSKRRCSPWSPPTTPHRPPAHHQLESAQLHFLRDMLGHVSRAQQPLVSGAIRGIFTATSAAEARARLAQVVEQLRPHAPKVAALLEDAEAELLAFSAFPLLLCQAAAA